MNLIDPYLLKYELDYRRELAMASRPDPRAPRDRARLRRRRRQDAS